MNQVINSFIMSLNSISRGFCNYAGSMFVQSGILIILLLIIDFLLRKRVRAVFRYCIWMLVFVKLILPPTLSLPTGIGYWSGEIPSLENFVSKPISNMSETEPFKPIISDDLAISTEFPQNQANQFPPQEVASQDNSFALSISFFTWQAGIFSIWLIGVLVFSVLLIQRMFFVRSLLLRSKPAKGRLLDTLNQCRQQAGIRRCIELKLSNHLQSPAVCGLFRPSILMPTTLLEKLSCEKLRAVLIHELAHIKRGDLWVNLVQTILQIIYFYNPFVWLANTVVRRIREQAVDEVVLVALGNEAESYSNTLIDIAETVFWKTNLSLRLIGVAESKKALYRRIKHMLTRPIPKSAKLGVLGLLVVAILAALLLPMAAAATKDNKNDEPKFIANLPNNVTVELVAVCSWPEEGVMCWQPDGAPSEKQLSVEKSKGEGKYGFIVQVDAPEDLSFKWRKIEGADGWHGSCNVYDEQGNKLDGFEAVHTDIKEDRSVTSLSVGVTAGPWETIAEHDGKKMAIKNTQQGAFLFSKAYEQDNAVAIVVSGQWQKDNDQRIIAIDVDGNTHTKYSGSVASGDIQQMEGKFYNLKLNKIEKFAVQTRQLNQVTFKNVSLKPGVKTDVEVEIEKATPAAKSIYSGGYGGGGGGVYDGGPQWIPSDWPVGPKENNYALQFNGICDYVKIPGNPSLDIRGSLTLSAWVKNNGDNDGQIIWRGDNQGGRDPYELHITNERMEFRIDAGKGTSYSVRSNGKVDNIEHFWTGVYNKQANKIHIYKDGILENSSDINEEIEYDTSSMWNIIGAADFGNWQHFRGVIDEVRIWNIARTQDQIKQDMSRSLRGNEANLVAYWKFDEGIGSTLRDLSANHNDGQLNTWKGRTGYIRPGVKPDAQVEGGSWEKWAEEMKRWGKEMEQWGEKTKQWEKDKSQSQPMMPSMPTMPQIMVNPSMSGTVSPMPAPIPMPVIDANIGSELSVMLPEILSGLMPRVMDGVNSLKTLQMEKVRLEKEILKVKNEANQLQKQNASKKEIETVERKIESLQHQLAVTDDKLKKQEKLFEEDIEQWGKQFEKQMENWGEQFGKHMENWGEQFGENLEKQIEQWAEQFEKQMEKLEDQQEEEELNEQPDEQKDELKEEHI